MYYVYHRGVGGVGASSTASATAAMQAQHASKAEVEELAREEALIDEHIRRMGVYTIIHIHSQSLLCCLLWRS